MKTQRLSIGNCNILTKVQKYFRSDKVFGYEKSRQIKWVLGVFLLGLCSSHNFLHLTRNYGINILMVILIKHQTPTWFINRKILLNVKILKNWDQKDAKPIRLFTKIGPRTATWVWNIGKKYTVVFFLIFMFGWKYFCFINFTVLPTLVIRDKVKA